MQFSWPGSGAQLRRLGEHVRRIYFHIWPGLVRSSNRKYAGKFFYHLIADAFLLFFYLIFLFPQTYLQSTSVNDLEKRRIMKRDTDQWMSHRLLPQPLRERIRRHEQYTWQVTRGVNEEFHLQNLPRDVRRDVKRHLCLDLVKQVSPNEVTIISFTFSLLTKLLWF